MKIDKYFDFLESLLSKSKLIADWRLSFMEDISSSFAPSKGPIIPDINLEKVLRKILVDLKRIKK